jgi:hypothetical protein
LGGGRLTGLEGGAWTSLGPRTCWQRRAGRASQPAAETPAAMTEKAAAAAVRTRL